MWEIISLAVCIKQREKIISDRKEISEDTNEDEEQEEEQIELKC